MDDVKILETENYPMSTTKQERQEVEQSVNTSTIFVYDQFENEEHEQLIPSEKAFVTRRARQRIMFGANGNPPSDSKSITMKEEVKHENRARFSTFVTSSFLGSDIC